MKVYKNKRLVADVDVAVSTLSRIKGLMGRKLDKNQGLLMIFSRSGYHSIWMMGMLQAIDIVFIDGKKSVINVETANPISFDPRTWKTYFPQRPAKFVLELNPTSGVKVGETLRWS